MVKLECAVGIPIVLMKMLPVYLAILHACETLRQSLLAAIMSER
jgi:hypothetical protein